MSESAIIASGPVEGTADQAAVIDSLLDDSNIVGSPNAESLAENPAEFQAAQEAAEAEQQQEELGYTPEEQAQIQEELEAQLEQEHGQEQQEQAEQPQEQAQQPQPINTEQWLNNAYQFAAAKVNSPEMNSRFSYDFLTAFGMDQQTATQFAQSPQAQHLGNMVTTYLMSAINTIMPMYMNAPSGKEGVNMLQHMIGSQYEGFNEQAERSSLRAAWNEATKDMPDLPEYDTRAFSKFMDKAFQARPDIPQLQFNGPDGKPLPPAQNRVEQYKLAISLAKGQRLNPELAAMAFKAGQKSARQSQIRRSAGNLGQGRSNQGFSQTDDFWDNPASWNNYVDKKL